MNIKTIISISCMLVLLGGCEKENSLEKDISNINNLIESEPKNADLYFERSKIYSRYGNKLKALDDLNMAISIDSTNSSYLSERVNLLGSLKQYELLIKDCRRYIQLVENDRTEKLKVYEMMCMAYSYLENPDSILKYAKISHELGSKNMSIYLHEAKAHNYLGNTKSTLSMLTKYLENNDDSLAFEALKYRAFLYKIENNLRAALNDYIMIENKIKNLKQDDRVFKAQIAWLYKELNKPDSAKYYFEKVKNFKDLKYSIFNNDYYYKVDPDILSKSIDSLLKAKTNT